MSKWCRVPHGEYKVLSCRVSKERNVQRRVRVSAAHDEEGAVSWQQTLKSEATLSVKRAKRVRAMKINIARTVRRTYALVEVVSVHAAASACEVLGQKNKLNETRGLQSRSGLLNCSCSIAPFGAEIFHRCHYEEEHELECHLHDDHFQDASVQDASVMFFPISKFSRFHS